MNQTSLQKLDLAQETETHRIQLSDMVHKAQASSGKVSSDEKWSRERMRVAFKKFEGCLRKDVECRDGRIRTFLTTVQSAYIGLMKSRKCEKLCPFPGQLQQRMDSIQHLECVCQYLEQVGHRLSPRNNFTFEKDIYVMADSILYQCGRSQEFFLSEISQIPDKSFENRIETLFGPIECLSGKEIDELVGQCSKLMKSFDTLLDYFVSCNPYDASSLQKYVNELNVKFKHFAATYKYMRNNYIPKI